MKDAESAESKEKENFWFLFFEFWLFLVIFVPQFSFIFITKDKLIYMIYIIPMQNWILVINLNKTILYFKSNIILFTKKNTH